MIPQALGHYQVLEKIGAGGMGEVYRARDTRLGRDVAIKLLPELFARDPERLARFEREAQLLASLNHPNIAAIYGLEEAAGTRYLVLEYVPGKTLTSPVPIEEALTICRQIAEALEAAHETGIMHRDLKPANVKITPENKIKVLDFGLAKVFADEGPPAVAANSPTLSAAPTRAGTILGTAAYMSPEQARARPLDKRTDIWSFGCVLYELLTGRQVFGGETVSDTIARLLEREPDWQALPPATPDKIRELLRRCLQKVAARRLHDIADARIEIEDALAAPQKPEPASSVPIAPATLARWRQAIPWTLALAAIAVAAWSLWRAPQPAARPMMRFAVSLPQADRTPSIALSPDGARLAYVASQFRRTQIYLRAMDQLEAKPISGTEGGDGPFFSPDGQWVAFYAAGKLKKVPVNGGAAVTLCDAPLGARGGSWGLDDTIIFPPARRTGLSRVSAAGGSPQTLTTLDAKKGERTHRLPQILPGGQAVLFTIAKAAATTPEAASIAVLSLQTGEQRSLVEGASAAVYVSTGHLVYAREHSLFAVAFDLGRLQVTGPPAPVLEGLAISAGRVAEFAVSNLGTLVYLPGGSDMAARTLVWVDRRGGAQALTAPPRAYRHLRLSPDGRRVAVDTADPDGRDVWVYELARGTLTRLTFQFNNVSPVWTPDGRRVTFHSFSGDNANFSWVAADGSAPPESLSTVGRSSSDADWSPDGKTLTFRQQDPVTQSDIWVLPMDGDRKPRPFLQTRFNETSPAFYPDGRWLAYSSDETGQFEVYVVPFPGPGGKWQVSTGGGAGPRWAGDGRELFYRAGDKMMVVEVETRPTFRVGIPKALFEGRYDLGYDVGADGKRFLMMKGIEGAPETQAQVVLEWFDELRRRAPAGKK